MKSKGFSFHPFRAGFLSKYLLLAGLLLSSLFANAQTGLTSVQYWNHLLQAGENLETIAEYYGVDVSVLQECNASFQDHEVRRGTEIIKVPVYPIALNRKDSRYALYTTRSGDQLHQLAQQYGISIADLKRLNRLQSNYLEPGSRILLPNTSFQLLHTDAVSNSDWTNRTQFRGSANFGFYADNDYEGNKELYFLLNGRSSYARMFVKQPWKFTFGMNTALGYRKVVGKPINKYLDRFEIKNQLQYRFTRRLHVYGFLGVRSQFFKTKLYYPNDLVLTHSSFMSPGHTHAALGLVYNHEHFNLNFGLLDRKTTYVLNQEVYGSRELVFGVPKGKKKVSNLGISLRADLYLYHGENVKIIGYSYAFVNDQNQEVDLRIDASYMVTKRLRLSLLQEVYYENTYSNLVQYKTEVMVGYSFFNTSK